MPDYEHDSTVDSASVTTTADNSGRLTAGVLGGLGPAATIDFMRRVLELTPAETDQEHIRMIVDQNPTLPSRQRAILDGGESPAEGLAEMASGLEAAGAHFLVMPCNTAHVYAADIVCATRIPFVSIVDVTIDALGNEAGPVGLLETPALAAAGLYRDALAARGVDCVVLDDGDCDRLMEFAYAVKQGNVGAAIRAGMKALAAGLVARGAGAIVAACTEVPLVLSANEVAVPLIESTDALARETVAIALGDAPLPPRNEE